MIVRTITQADYHEVDQLIRKAFTSSSYGYGNEAELVQKIRAEKHYQNELEVVAVEDQQILGHGLLSDVVIESKEVDRVGLVLAPLSVLPDCQQRGIGKLIMSELERRATELGYPYISILGHPTYYTRFGYTAAKNFGIVPPFEVPDEAFLIKPLTKDGLKNCEGILRYSQAFA
ncbi:N-acetyltransferase [Vagococcus sp. BWB3-3]|uniref:N-acetyltransferase n=1 Tax=Vagococcus allomyrinae TaxID=2794353 RepID=A0A940P4Q2_9ENTE|nr:N-acetyltransferase [Vagococcus allomyrinae]MBP1041000.1 N-acetyltransferase [Vagococcus allomyrinae]